MKQKMVCVGKVVDELCCKRIKIIKKIRKEGYNER